MTHIIDDEIKIAQNSGQAKKSLNNQYRKKHNSRM